MPNWCYGRLELKGSVKDLKHFETTMKGIDRTGEETILNEEVLIPYPKKFLEMDAKVSKIRKQHQLIYDKDKVDGMNDKQRDEWFKKNPYTDTKDGFNSGGYEWCLRNWGTKWGFCSPEVSERNKSGTRIVYKLETAWSAPIPLLEKMAEKFKSIEFKFSCSYEFDEQEIDRYSWNNK